RLCAGALTAIECGRIQKRAYAGKSKGPHSQQSRSAQQVRAFKFMRIVLHRKWIAGVAVREARIAVSDFIPQPRVVNMAESRLSAQGIHGRDLDAVTVYSRRKLPKGAQRNFAVLQITLRICRLSREGR